MFRVGLKRAGLAGHSLRAGLRSPVMATALNAGGATSAVERAAVAAAGSNALLSGIGGGLSGGVGCGLGVAYGALNTALGSLQLVRWATKKAAGSSSNKKDSPGKHLGVKVFGGAWVEPGHIIVRQRGTKWHAGMNVALGKDHTISALVPGHVRFTHTERPYRHGTARYRTWVSVVPHGQDPAILRAYFDANQSRYARIISDKYHRVPRSVWAPRERAAAVIERDALRHAVEEDAARQRVATVAFVAAASANTTAAAAGAGADAVAPASAFALPHLIAPLRAHSTVTRIRSAMALLGERLRKPGKRAPKPATVRESTAAQPVPTVAPGAPTYVAKA